MERLTLAQFRERSEDCERAVVAASSDGTVFCDGPLWQLAAHDHLHRTPVEARHLIAERDGAWLLFAEQEQESPGILFPLEAAWMFGCPLVGEPEPAVDLLIEAGRQEPGLVVFIGGVEHQGGLHRQLHRVRSRPGGIREFPGTDVMLIDLADGVDAWLERRSKKFRRTLRTACEDDGAIGLADVSSEPPERLFDRILAVQRRTYKWREGTDIFLLPEYRAFYRDLLSGLHRTGHLRVIFATRDGEDLAYIFGGILGRSYRGLQMSYIDECRDLGLGNRLQLENLRRCAEEGIATYDLGMHAPYKERWADRIERRVGLLWVS
ncbi:MAG TPA: GNAT family N-acetyltransferase [Bacteroidia bacterium]|nr:GNAT family N-acetyltransferase [Bacteroidia bacterium]